MEMKELQYFFEGLSSTLSTYYEEIYEILVSKGKKKMGQEAGPDTPQISELIKRTREQQSISDLMERGKEGQEELIQAIGAQVKKILSSAGIVTRHDLARLERRMDHIEQELAAKEKQGGS